MPYSIKRNTCKYQGCEGFIWARGLCKNHDRRENPHKHGLSAKPKTTSKIIKNNIKKPTGEKALFEALWATRSHVSFVSGKRVGPIAHTFAHCIPKGLYPKFKLYDKNIVFLTPEEHYEFDFGTEESQRKLGGDWDKLYILREELLKEYRKL
jgi:hypothetical protein